MYQNEKRGVYRNFFHDVNITIQLLPNHLFLDICKMLMSFKFSNLTLKEANFIIFPYSSNELMMGKKEMGCVPMKFYKEDLAFVVYM